MRYVVFACLLLGACVPVPYPYARYGVSTVTVEGTYYYREPRCCAFEYRERELREYREYREVPRMIDHSRRR